MRKSIALAAAALALAARLLWNPAPVAVIAQSLAAADNNVRQFRLVAGVTDVTSRDWSGRVTVSGGGELIAIRGWRFASGEDRVANDGQFRFKTRIGPAENQLNPGAPYGQTDWDSGAGVAAGQRLIPAGLTVRVRGPETARVSVSLGGDQTIAFAIGELSYTKPFTALAGNAKVERLPVESLLSENGMQDDQPALAIAPDGGAWTAWLSYQDAGDWVVGTASD